MTSSATGLLLRYPNDNVLVVKNNNNADSTISKAIIPFQFFGLPYVTHEQNKVPDTLEILRQHKIQVREGTGSDVPLAPSGMLVEKITTPNFIDSVYNIDYETVTLDETDKLDFPDSQNNFSYHLLPATQLLRDFRDCKLALTPDALRILQRVTTGKFPDLDLEYSPGFHCFPILSNTIPPFKTTNLIVVHSKNSALVVDPGASQSGKEEFVGILQKLKNMGVTDLQVFITHHHKDHWEGLRFLSDPAVFGKGEITILGHSSSLHRMEFDFAKRETADGDVINIGDVAIRVVHTPGHTDGSLSLFHEPTRTLVAGDHIVGMGSAVLDPYCGNMKQYFESTKKMIALNPRVAYPAHGPPNFAPVQLLETYIKHRQAREDAILAAYNSGKHTLDDIVKTVYGDVSESLWTFAKSNISLHLAKLKEDGKILDSAL